MNKNSFRVIFSKVSRAFIAVAEITCCRCRCASNGTLSKSTFKRESLMQLTTLGVVVAALFGHVTVVSAQMVAYKNASGPQPAIDHAANGRPLIQIVAPNASGLSHNKYDQFNVDAVGVILNNSPGTIQTQLGGFIQGNPNLSTSRKSAGIILNEVLGTNRSQLNGYIEVAGQRADVIVANPNGISVGNGAGFINATRAVLTTGIPTFAGDGGLSEFRVTKGDITIGAGGLNSADTSQLDLIARSVDVNDNIWANRLNIITGSNQVNYTNLGVQIIPGEGGKPTVGIDSSALGGMYAQKIMLVGTEAGVGVRTMGNLAASGGDISIDNHGKITINGNVNASGQINVRSDDDFTQTATMYALQSTTIISGGQLTNTGALTALHDVTLQADTINSNGALAAGINSAGQAAEVGNLNLSATGLLSATGQNIAGGNITIAGTSLNLANATTSARGTTTLNATAGNINNNNATLQSNGTISISATGSILNDDGVITGNSQIQVTAAELNNDRGQITANGAITANTTGDFLNQSGQVQAGQRLLIQGTDVDNTAGRLVSLNADGIVINARGVLTNASGNTSIGEQGGMIGGNGDMTLTSQQLNNNATIIAGDNLTVTVEQGNNTGGRMVAGGTLELVATKFNNTSGTLDSFSLVALADTLNNNGGTISADQLQLSGTNVSNQQGKIIQYGKGDSNLTITGQIDNSNQGLIQSNSTNLTVSAQQLNNDGGTIAHAGNGLFNICLDDALNNRTGSIGSNGTLQVSASTLQNQNGNLFGAVDTRLTSTGDIKNGSGFIGSMGDLYVNAVRVDNVGGTLYSHGNMETQVIDTLMNEAGAIQSDGSLTLIVGNTFDNRGGQLEANGTNDGSSLLLSAGSVTNDNGRIASSGTGSTTINTRTTLSNITGTIGGNGEVNLTATTLNNSQLGQLISAGDMNLSVSNQLSNVRGKIYAGQNLTMQPTQASVDNTQGAISGAGNISLTVGSVYNTQGQINHVGSQRANITVSSNKVDNAGGSITSNTDLNINTSTFVGEGVALAGNNAFINLHGDYTNTAGSLFSANNVLQFGVTGNLTNYGTFSAPNGVILRAYNIMNANGALINSYQTDVLAQGNLINQGRIYGDFLGVGANYLLNDKDAVIAARSDLQIGAQTMINQDHGYITSLGSINIAGALDGNYQAVGKATAITNSQATMDAGGDFFINAGMLNNLNPTFATKSVVVDQRQIVEYAFNATELVWMLGSPVECGGATEGLPCLSNNKKYWILNTSDGQSSNDFWQRIYTQTTIQDQVIATDPGQIYATGQINLNIDIVNNQASAIVSGLGANGRGDYLHNDTPQGHTTYIKLGIPNGVGETGRFGTSHHNSHNKSDNWSPFSPIDEQIAGPTALLSIWPGDVNPPRLSNPAQDNNAGANKLTGGTAGNIGQNSAGTTDQAVQYASGSGGNVAALSSSTQTVALPGAAIPNLKLPGNQLFIIQTQPGKTYVVETDPAFTNYSNFISSDYLLSRLSINPAATQLRLGDGFYEQKLINDQLTQLTGRRLLADFSNTEQQYEALMTAGVYAAEQMNLAVGIALSAEQMAALTSDIVWLVSQKITLPGGSQTDVLVPVVYLAQLNASDVRPTGAIISASDINLAYSDNVQNSGTIQANNNLIVNASNISNSGAMMANSTGGQLILAAQHDVASTGAISANRVGIVAGDNINIASTTQTITRPTSSNTTLTQIASVNADQLVMQAGKDINLNAAQVDITGNALIQAGNNLNIGTVNIATSSQSDFGGGGHYNTSQSQDVGTQIHSNGDLNLTAGQDINAKAAYASSDGQLTLAAGHDINLSTGTAQSSTDIALHTTEHGMFSSTTKDLVHKSDSTQALGSTISGDSVQVVAGHDINVAGGNIVASNDVGIFAANNINITTSEDTFNQSDYQKQSKSGFFSGSTIGITYGNQEQTDANQTTAVTHQGSLIGSLSGNVVLQAGNNVDVKGSDIIAQRDIMLLGTNINIGQEQNVLTQSEQHAYKQSGITLSLGTPTINVATSMAQNAQRASQVDDPRLKKLYATQAATTALTNADTAANEARQIGNGDTGSISVNVSVGSSKSESQNTSHLSQVQGSNLLAGGNLTLIASGKTNDPTQGNISITGSQLSGVNTTLVASNDILIQSAQETRSNQSTSNSSGWNAGVGFSLGKETGIVISANGSQAKSNGNGGAVNQVNSEVTASKQFTIVSGRDTIMNGATVHANQIAGSIGRDLTITSLQDIESYQSQQNGISGGGSYTFGAGAVSASVSANRSNTNADFAKVNQQSGMIAGSGGYNINVGNHTQLNGAIISSTAASDQNSLITTSFDYTDILNHKQYQSSASSMGASTGSLAYEAGKSVLGALVGNANAEGSSTSITRATISPGNIEVRNGDNAAIDNINRDVTVANTGLQHDNIQQIAQTTQNSSEAGQVIANIAGQYADKAHAVILDKDTKDNQLYRVVCKQEPCTYDRDIQSDPNRHDSDGNPNVQLVHITQDDLKNMSPEERKNVVVATNGIFNDPQRAGELALQNSDAIKRPETTQTGNTKPEIFLVNSPYSGNVISDSLVAGYEKVLKFLDYTNPDLTLAETLKNVGLDNVTLLAHSRGTLVANNALQILIDEGIHSNTMKVQLKGPALFEETITKTVGQLRTSDSIQKKNPPQYSSFINDPVSTLIGFSNEGKILPSLIEIPKMISNNSAHSCYGTGIAGCAQIENPYSYAGMNPVDLQKLRQDQVDTWLKQGAWYKPNLTVNPANGILPTPLYFQPIPFGGGNALLPVISGPSRDERVDQLRDLQRQLQGKE